MKCRVCGCYQEPKDNWRSILTAFVTGLLIGFIGCIFFYDWKIISRLDKQIEKDKSIKEELQKGYLPPKVDSKVKQGVIK